MTPSARQTKLVAAGTAPGSLHASSAIAPLARRAHRRSHSPRAEDHHAIVEKRSQQQPSQSRTTPAPAKNLSRPAARQWPLARTSTALPDSRRFVRALNDTSERLNGHAGIAWLKKIVSLIQAIAKRALELRDRWLEQHLPKGPTAKFHASPTASALSLTLANSPLI